MSHDNSKNNFFKKTLEKIADFGTPKGERNLSSLVVNGSTSSSSTNDRHRTEQRRNDAFNNTNTQSGNNGEARR